MKTTISETFETKKAAEARAAQIYARRPPQAYSTTLRVTPGTQSGVWWLTGYHFNSAD